MEPSDIGGILAQMSRVAVAVVGDFGVDRYWTVDPDLRDVSRETGLPIRQVVAVQERPGGAGTVLNQLYALGVGRVIPVGVLGDDPDALFLRAEFLRMGFLCGFLVDRPGRTTPSYHRILTLPGMDDEQRYDVFARETLQEEDEAALVRFIGEVADACDVLVVSDYTEPFRPGILTPRVCEAVSTLGSRGARPRIIVDSRLQASRFRRVPLKMNQEEFQALIGESGDVTNRLWVRGCEIAGRQGRALYVTLGAQGLMVCEPDRATHVPGFPVDGETDIVGAGDVALAGIAAALATGADSVTAGLLGVLASSITVQQVRTTGVATPAEILRRWRKYQDSLGDGRRKP